MIAQHLDSSIKSFEQEGSVYKITMAQKHTRFNFQLLWVWIGLAILTPIIAGFLQNIQFLKHYIDVIEMVLIFTPVLGIVTGLIILTIFIFNKAIYDADEAYLLSKNKTILNKLGNINNIISKKTVNINELTICINTIDDIIDALVYLTKNKSHLFFPNTIKWIFEILQVLKTKLLHEIEGLKSKLHWSISDLKNLEMTLPELRQLAWLQSTRLDHQIKQFEELEKVLVKI